MKKSILFGLISLLILSGESNIRSENSPFGFNKIVVGGIAVIITSGLIYKYADCFYNKYINKYVDDIVIQEMAEAIILSTKSNNDIMRLSEPEQEKCFRKRPEIFILELKF